MNQKLKIFIGLIIFVVCVSFMTAQDSNATVRLFDGKVILNGYLKEVGFYRTALTSRDDEYHDHGLDYLKSSAGIEALLNIKETEDYSLRFFTGMKWWYEASMRVNKELGRTIPHDSKKNYITPRSFDDDVLNEAYIDFIKGPFQVRVGKQVVVWGNLDVDRAADVVNAVDFRHSMFGIDKWEEFKRGAWMIRTFYQTELPGNLRFEIIFNPGDFRRNMIPFDEGYHYGPDGDERLKSIDNPGFSFEPAGGYGYAGYLGEQMRRDAPEKWNTSNWELGLKVSGYTWNWDWSLIYYDHINKDPVADPENLTEWATEYFTYAVAGVRLNSWPWFGGPKVFKYKRSQIVGATLEREILGGGPAFRGGILTFEFFYEIGTPLNKTFIGGEGATGNMYPGTIVRRDIVGGAVKFYQRINIPWFTNSFIATGKQFEYTLTYFMEKVLNHDRELVLGSRYHKFDQSIADSISFFAIQQMFNFSWTFVFNSYYKPRLDKWFVAPAVRYMFPGSQFYVETGYVMYGGAKQDKWTNSYFDVHKNSIFLKLVYEF